MTTREGRRAQAGKAHLPGPAPPRRRVLVTSPALRSRPAEEGLPAASAPLAIHRGFFPSAALPTVRVFKSHGQLTAGQLVDRYPIACAERQVRAKSSRDEAQVVGRTVYLHTPEGYPRSELRRVLARAGGPTSAPWPERRATGRRSNWPSFADPDLRRTFRPMTASRSISDTATDAHAWRQECRAIQVRAGQVIDPLRRPWPTAGT